MSDDPGITGDASAADLLLAKGGKPGALHVTGRAELKNVIVRPGFLRWTKDDPKFNLKALAKAAAELPTQDLMASLAARHLQKLEKKVERRQDTSEFTPAKPKVVAGATKSVALNGFGAATTTPLKKFLCCLTCIAGGGIITYLLITKGVIKV